MGFVQVENEGSSQQGFIIIIDGLEESSSILKIIMTTILDRRVLSLNLTSNGKIFLNFTGRG